MFFCSFSVASVTPWINNAKPIVISFVSLFDIISIAFLDLNILSWITAVDSEAAAVNFGGTNTFLAIGVNTSYIINNGNGPKGLPRNAPDCIIFDSWVFDNFTLTNETFEKIFVKT